jgi:hypothetical protein
MPGKHIKAIFSVLLFFSAISLIDIELTKAEEYPFGVYAISGRWSTSIDKNSGYHQIAECGFNHVFGEIDSAWISLSSIKKAGLKAYFYEIYLNTQYRGVAHYYSMGHFTKWEAEGNEIAGYRLLQHKGGHDDGSGAMVWRVNNPGDTAGVIISGPNSGYYQCYTHEWGWSPWVPWKASFKLKTNGNSGSDTVAIISAVIQDSLWNMALR